jgi:hypothetical protein
MLTILFLCSSASIAEGTHKPHSARAPGERGAPAPRSCAAGLRWGRVLCLSGGSGCVLVLPLGDRPQVCMQGPHGVPGRQPPPCCSAGAVLNWPKAIGPKGNFLGARRIDSQNQVLGVQLEGGAARGGGMPKARGACKPKAHRLKGNF